MEKLRKIKDIEGFITQFLKDHNYSKEIQIYNSGYHLIDLLKIIDYAKFKGIILDIIENLVSDDLLIINNNNDYFLNIKHMKDISKLDTYKKFFN